MHESLKLSEHSQEKKLSTGVHENKKRIVGNRPVLGRSVGRVQGGEPKRTRALEPSLFIARGRCLVVQ
jgi:hypothetical protein